MRFSLWYRLILPACALSLIPLAPTDRPLAAEANSIAAGLQAQFQQSCIQCHGQDKKAEGEVDLFSLKSDADLVARPKLIEDIDAGSRGTEPRHTFLRREIQGEVGVETESLRHKAQ